MNPLSSDRSRHYRDAKHFPSPHLIVFPIDKEGCGGGKQGTATFSRRGTIIVAKIIAERLSPSICTSPFCRFFYHQLGSRSTWPSIEPVPRTPDSDESRRVLHRLHGRLIITFPTGEQFIAPCPLDLSRRRRRRERKEERSGDRAMDSNGKWRR